MAGKTGVTVRVLYNNIPKTSAQQVAAIQRAVVETLVEVETGSKERCPVDTGRLRGSITHQMISETEGVVGTGPQAPYGVYVHEGTGRVSGRPFMRQAAEAVRSRWLDRIRKALA